MNVFLIFFFNFTMKYLTKCKNNVVYSCKNEKNIIFALPLIHFCDYYVRTSVFGIFKR